jgi:hypothetical protein
MKAYLLRDVPPELWRKIKTLAAERGQTIRGLILAALQKEVKR